MRWEVQEAGVGTSEVPSREMDKVPEDGHKGTKD